jgi:MFS transporter, DHA2 family, multidrug resistance protein
VVFLRGIGAIVGMPVIGYLGGRVDARYLLTFGFLVFGFTALIFGNVNLSLGPDTLLWPIVITGFALSFVFVPMTTECYAALKNEQIGNATGIFNLVRNVGGSAGISAAQTLITRRADLHQNQIINSAPRTQFWLQQSIAGLDRQLGRFSNPANAPPQARGFLYHQLGQQALLWAYVDVFRWLALLAFGCIGLVWLFRRVEHRRSSIAAH